jgi:hypothetical protein
MTIGNREILVGPDRAFQRACNARATTDITGGPGGGNTDLLNARSWRQSAGPGYCGMRGDLFAGGTAVSGMIWSL